MGTMDDPRTVVHVDMDAFFAQVEVNDNPDLEGRPVIVGGTGKRGVVSTASYEAREYGVHSAMPMSEARRLCPEAHVLPLRGERYRDISRRIKDVLRSITPHVQSVSLDEAFLDVTGSLHRYESKRHLGQNLRNRVFEETELTCSVGVGPNKMIAKLASEACKPDGLLRVPDEEKVGFLRDLPVESMWGVGPSTRIKMNRLGIETVGDLQEIELGRLQSEFDHRAAVLRRRAHGVDPSPVKTEEETKSISNETTFPRDLTDREELENRMYPLAAKVGRRLRENNLVARTVKIKVRRGDFTTLTRRSTRGEPGSTTERIWESARRLLREVELDARGVRLLGVGAENLRRGGEQRDLFEDSRVKRRETINRIVDDINDEFGEGTLTRGRDRENLGTD